MKVLNNNDTTRFSPNALISQWRAAYGPRIALKLAQGEDTPPSALPAASAVWRMESDILSWDKGQSQVWGFEARRQKTPAIQAQREQCCQFYLAQIEAAFRGEPVDMETFLRCAQGIMQANPRRFRPNKVLYGDICAMQQFFERPDVALTAGTLSALLAYYTDEEARKKISTLHMRAHAAYLNRYSLMQDAAAAIIRNADYLDKRANVVYEALKAWDSATTWFGALVAWGSLLLRGRYFFPEHARAFYRAHTLSNGAQLLKVTSVQELLTEPKCLDSLGDVEVRNMLQTKNAKSVPEKTSSASIAEIYDSAIKVLEDGKTGLSASAVNESGKKVFVQASTILESTKGEAAKKAAAQMLQTGESRLMLHRTKWFGLFIKTHEKSLSLISEAARNIHEFLNEPSDISCLDKIKTLLEMSTVFINLLEYHANHYLDCESKRGNKRVFEWLATIADGPIKNTILSLDQAMVALYIALESKFNELVSTAAQENGDALAQIVLLLDVARSRLSMSAEGADIELFNDYATLLRMKRATALENNKTNDQATCINEIAAQYEAAQAYLLTAEFAKLTVGEVVAWKKALHEATQSTLDVAGLVGDKRRKVLNAVSESKAVLLLGLKQWGETFSHDWEQTHKGALNAEIGRIKQQIKMYDMTAPSVDDMKPLLEAGLALLTMLDTQARHYLDKTCVRGNKHLFHWLSDVFADPANAQCIRLDKQVLGIQANLEKRVKQCLAPLQEALLEAFQEEARLIDKGWEPSTLIARYNKKADALLGPVRKMLQAGKAQVAALQKGGDMPLFQDYEYLLEGNHNAFGIMLEQKAKAAQEKSAKGEYIVEVASDFWGELRECVKRGDMPSAADEVFRNYKLQVAQLAWSMGEEQKCELKKKEPRFQETCLWVSDWLAYQKNVKVESKAELSKEFKTLVLIYHPDRQPQGDVERALLAEDIFKAIKKHFDKKEEAMFKMVPFEEVDVNNVRACERYIASLRHQYEAMFEELMDQMLEEAREDVSLKELREASLKLDTQINMAMNRNTMHMVVWGPKKARLKENEHGMFVSFMQEMNKLSEDVLKKSTLSVDEQERLMILKSDAIFVLTEARSFAIRSRSEKVWKGCIETLRVSYERGLISGQRMLENAEKLHGLKEELVGVKEELVVAKEKLRIKEKLVVAKEKLAATEEKLSFSEQARIAAEERAAKAEEALKKMKAAQEQEEPKNTQQQTLPTDPVAANTLPLKETSDPDCIVENGGQGLFHQYSPLSHASSLSDGDKKAIFVASATAAVK